MCHSSRMALRKHDCRAIARGHNARVVRPFRSPAGAPQEYRCMRSPAERTWVRYILDSALRPQAWGFWEVTQRLIQTDVQGDLHK